DREHGPRDGVLCVSARARGHDRHQRRFLTTSMGALMIRRTLLPAVLVMVAAGGKQILDVKPINEGSEDAAITSPAGARAALAGRYDGLQSTNYYGGTSVSVSAPSGA